MRRPDRVALHQDRVHHAFDVGDQAPRRDQRRMHAQLDALARPLRDAQQLDPVARAPRRSGCLPASASRCPRCRPSGTASGCRRRAPTGWSACARRPRPRCRRSGRPRRSPASALPSAPSANGRPLSRISERMKFEVPLMMPAIHSMRLAARPSRSALMIGMPPATEASKATITPFFCAASKISLPCVASSALFAVTTCLPLRIASSTSSLAMPVAADQLDDDVDVSCRAPPRRHRR